MIRGAALALLALVAWLSLTPEPPVLEIPVPDFADLVVHAVMHTVLAAALMLGWPGAGRIALAYLLAVLLELGQLWVPGRLFDLRDMGANLAGAAWGAGLAAAHGDVIPRWLR